MSDKPVFTTMRVIFLMLFIVCGVVFTLGTALRGRFPAPGKIDQALLVDPIQNPTDAAPFLLHYAGNTYHVTPQATYRLQGLVVTHNNITGFADIYHDSSSVDTKDICVVYGNNIRTGAYRQTEFWSGSWTCYARTEMGFLFDDSAFSNNHLITNSDAIREQIADIRIGDQVVVEGMLVDYYPVNMPGSVRASSLTRNDTGNGACEVLFVENVRVLKQGTPLAYIGRRYGFFGMVLALIGLLGTLVVSTHSKPRNTYSSRWGEYKGY